MTTAQANKPAPAGGTRRAAALRGVTEHGALGAVYRQVLDHLKSGSRRDVEWYYDLGEMANAVRDGGETFGPRGYELLLEALGEEEKTRVSRSASLARRVPRRRALRLADRGVGPDRRPLFVSHLLTAVDAPDDETLEHILGVIEKEGPSVRELRALLPGHGQRKAALPAAERPAAAALAAPAQTAGPLGQLMQIQHLVEQLRRALAAHHDSLYDDLLDPPAGQEVAALLPPAKELMAGFQLLDRDLDEALGELSAAIDSMHKLARRGDRKRA